MTLCIGDLIGNGTWRVLDIVMTNLFIHFRIEQFQNLINLTLVKPHFYQWFNSIFWDLLQPVWPDWTIYWTLGNFSKPLATINLPKSLTFLGNFCKRVKIYHFTSEIIFGQLLKTFGNFLLVTLVPTHGLVSNEAHDCTHFAYTNRVLAWMELSSRRIWMLVLA